MTQKELIVALDKWLAGKKSPMAGFSDYAVILARRNGVAVTLSTGIAQAETQCGTDPLADQIAIAGHNVWGYGHSPGTHGFLFDSYPDSINACTERLGQLVSAGYDTALKLSAIWVNGNPNSPNQQWADNVAEVMRAFGGNPDKLARAPLARAV